MGSRKSPMKAKAFMANMREFRIATRELRDDGVQRRLAREPVSSADLREKSRKYKPTRSERIRLELSRRAYMTPEGRAFRAELGGSVREFVDSK
jgi:hypothetical protein